MRTEWHIFLAVFLVCSILSFFGLKWIFSVAISYLMILSSFVLGGLFSVLLIILAVIVLIWSYMVFRAFFNKEQ